MIMIAGMCVVAAGFNRTQFCTNVANGISRVSKGSLNKMMFGYVLIGMLLSQFIQSPIVAMGIVTPMLLASAESMGLKSSKVVFPLGVATVVTCCTLPVGAGATVAAELNGYLESYGYLDHMVGILDPMVGRLPLLVICVIYCSFFATKFAPDEPIVKSITEVKQGAGRVALKPFQEYAGIFIFFADAVALMCAKQIGMQNWEITVIGALAMVLCGVLKPREATASLPVSMLLLIVGCLLYTSVGGHWEQGPGIDLFRRVKEALGEKEIIAEDLGYVTDSVRRLVAETGYPGMKVLELSLIHIYPGSRYG